MSEQNVEPCDNCHQAHEATSELKPIVVLEKFKVDDDEIDTCQNSQQNGSLKAYVCDPTVESASDFAVNVLVHIGHDASHQKMYSTIFILQHFT